MEILIVLFIIGLIIITGSLLRKGLIRLFGVTSESAGKFEREGGLYFSVARIVLFATLLIFFSNRVLDWTGGNPFLHAAAETTVLIAGISGMILIQIFFEWKKSGEPMRALVSLGMLTYFISAVVGLVILIDSLS